MDRMEGAGASESASASGLALSRAGATESGTGRRRLPSRACIAMAVVAAVGIALPTHAQSASNEAGAGAEAPVTPDAPAEGPGDAAAEGPADADAAEAPVVADPAELAFEQGRWEDAIAEYREILAKSPEDRLSLLRIAQAQRELRRYEAALATLEQARTANSPEAMVDVERARNLLALGRRDDGLAALDAADHVGLRALTLLESDEDFASVRSDPRFERVVRNVRSRVYPCEGEPEASQFDFWVGRWEVRAPDGTLIGHDTISKQNGGCAIVEQWDGSGGSSGTSVSFFVPSKGQWRQIWTGSSGTLAELSGGLMENGEMHMEGTVEYVDAKNIVAFRGTWTRTDDGTVRQKMEEFDLGAQTWIVWFDGIFRPMD